MNNDLNNDLFDGIPEGEFEPGLPHYTNSNFDDPIQNCFLAHLGIDSAVLQKALYCAGKKSPSETQLNRAKETLEDACEKLSSEYCRIQDGIYEGANQVSAAANMAARAEIKNSEPLNYLEIAKVSLAGVLAKVKTALEQKLKDTQQKEDSTAYTNLLKDADSGKFLTRFRLEKDGTLGRYALVKGGGRSGLSTVLTVENIRNCYSKPLNPHKDADNFYVKHNPPSQENVRTFLKTSFLNGGIPQTVGAESLTEGEVYTLSKKYEINLLEKGERMTKRYSAYDCDDEADVLFLGLDAGEIAVFDLLVREGKEQKVHLRGLMTSDTSISMNAHHGDGELYVSGIAPCDPGQREFIEKTFSNERVPDFDWNKVRDE